MDMEFCLLSIPVIITIIIIILNIILIMVAIAAAEESRQLTMDGETLETEHHPLHRLFSILWFRTSGGGALGTRRHEGRGG